MDPLQALAEEARKRKSGGGPIGNKPLIPNIIPPGMNMYEEMTEALRNRPQSFNPFGNGPLIPNKPLIPNIVPPGMDMYEEMTEALRNRPQSGVIPASISPFADRGIRESIYNSSPIPGEYDALLKSAMGGFREYEAPPLRGVLTETGPASPRIQRGIIDASPLNDGMRAEITEGFPAAQNLIERHRQDINYGRRVGDFVGESIPVVQGAINARREDFRPRDGIGAPRPLIEGMSLDAQDAPRARSALPPPRGETIEHDSLVDGISPTARPEEHPDAAALNAVLKRTADSAIGAVKDRIASAPPRVAKVEEDAPQEIPAIPIPDEMQGPSTFPDTLHKYKVRQDANVPAPEFSTQHDPEVVVPKVPVPAKTYDPTDTYDRMETTLLGKRIYPNQIPDYSRDESRMGDYSGNRAMGEYIAKIRAHNAQRAADRAMSEPSPGYTPAYTVNTKKINNMSAETEANVDRLRDERLAGKRARMENVIANTRQMFTPDQERQLREGGWTGANSPGIASNPYVFQAMLSQAVRDKQKQDMESRKLDIEGKRVANEDAATKAKVELLREGQKESPGDADKRKMANAESKLKFYALIDSMKENPEGRAAVIKLFENTFGVPYESPTSAAPSDASAAKPQGMPVKDVAFAGPVGLMGAFEANRDLYKTITDRLIEGLGGQPRDINDLWEWLSSEARKEDRGDVIAPGYGRNLTPEGPKNTKFKNGNR